MGDEVTWTITQLTDWLDAVIASSVPGEIWVEGEISNLNRSSSGHVYFTLVDSAGANQSSASLNITLFDWHRNNVNHLLRRAGGAVRMADGVRVRIRGEVKLYPQRSQYQLRMTTIDPAFTLGKLAAERAALLARLDADGLLHANAERTLAAVPLRVALVTSAESAAAADALHEFEAAGLGLHIVLVDTLVQGNDAPASLVEALRAAESCRPDVIAVVRGGGARTDLAAFDDETVARAIARCAIPVWCGLGHETDRSVSDEVAHQSFKTPTACASAIVDRVRSAVGSTESTWSAIQATTNQRIERAEHRLRSKTATVALRVGAGVERAERRTSAAASSVATRVERVVSSASVTITRHSADVSNRARAHLDDADFALAARTQIVRAHDPVRTLARGWSITRTADGDLVRGPELPAGTGLVTRTAGGDLHSTVTDR